MTKQLPKHERRINVWRTARLLISLAVVVSACGGKGQAPSALPTELLPAALVQPTEDPQQQIRLRVYAGSDFRMRLVNWEEEAREVLTFVSGLLQEASGARLELVEILEWNRSGGDMGKTLESLALLDPGRDVDLVLGLIDAPEALMTQVSELSAHERFGKHLVVRSFNRLAESESLKAELANLSEAEEDRLIAARRRHKQSALIANAMAQLFGAEVGGDIPAEAIDAASYDTQQTQLSPRARAILRLTVPAHLAGTSEAWRAARAQLEQDPAHAGLVQDVELHLAAIEAGSNKPEPTPSILRQVDREKLQQAVNLIAARKPIDAWARIEALLELYPGAAELMLPACQSAQMRAASDALAHCERATVAHPTSVPAWIALALSQEQAGDPGVKQSLDQASKLLSTLDANQERESWSALARAYQKLSLPRAAQRAAERGGPESVLAWAFESRTRYGSSTGVSEAEEASYLDALKTGLKYVYASDLKRARESSIALAKDFPKSIGSSLIAAELALRTRSYPAGLSACERVLQLQAENSWAHYLSGLLYGRQQKYAEATTFLSKAIELDPTLKAAYQTLADIYKKSKDARLGELQRVYKERFELDLK